jgi:hypothetical protein
MSDISVNHSALMPLRIEHTVCTQYQNIMHTPLYSPCVLLSLHTISCCFLRPQHLHHAGTAAAAAAAVQLVVMNMHLPP